MTDSLQGKTALITGAARRIGACVAERLHDAGMSVAIHYGRSAADAEALRDRLQAKRPNSVSLHSCDLCEVSALAPLVREVEARHGPLHALVNNASSFYPTKLGQTSESDWSDLIGTNLVAPFFLSQAAAAGLTETGGVIINMADIYGERPLPGHAVYNVAKAGLLMLTKTLAHELAPRVRVNAIAPGPILWPESSSESDDQAAVLRNTPLARSGRPEDIADAILFLIRDARFTTGATLPVDGGRSIAGY